MSNCDNCNIEHDESYSKRFCSKKCRYGFSTKAKRLEINKKIAIASRRSRGGRPYTEYVCKKCGKVFSSRSESPSCCSKSCTMKMRSFEARSLASSKAAQTQILNGTHQGFKFRRGKYATPSWAEAYFMKGLDLHGISYEREYKIANYFADFAFLDKKIVLEVDGKQHKYPDRIEHDRIRDEKMHSLGWKVIRIDWIKVGDEKMISEFEDFCKLVK